MIVYGFVTEESVIALFLAGIGPGLVLVFLFIVFSMFYARYINKFDKITKATSAQRRSSSIRALPSLMLLTDALLYLVPDLALYIPFKL